MLSRIDGQTSWKALRQIGGIAPEEVDRYLERWVKEGVIVVGGAELCQAEAEAGTGAGDPDPQPAAGEAGAAARPRSPEVDANLELPVELQQQILDFEAGLDRSYHELLGVDRRADTKEIKLAYFRMSKVYHPDRYFRRNIGTYAQRLDRIFKRVCEAYELLSDPTTRAEIERSMPEEPPSEGAYANAGGTSEKIGPEPRRVTRPRGPQVPMRVRNLQRLRARFKVSNKMLVERRFKARQFYDSARAAAHEKRWLEAAASMRLAIAFDAANPEYKSAFAEIQADVHRVRAEALIEQAAGTEAQADALRMLEEALNYRPMDVQVNVRAADLCLELGELDRAREYAETLCEIEPDDAGHHARLSRVLRRQGVKSKSREALDRAISLDRSHPDVAAELRLQSRAGKR